MKVYLFMIFLFVNSGVTTDESNRFELDDDLHDSNFLLADESAMWQPMEAEATNDTTVKANIEDDKSLEDELRSVMKKVKSKRDSKSQKHNYLIDFFDIENEQSARKLDYFDILFSTKRKKCPRLPLTSSKHKIKCRKESSEVGEIDICMIKCAKGYRLKEEFNNYETCGKQTKYRWSYELKNLKSPYENCIKVSKNQMNETEPVCLTRECLETGTYYTSKIDFSVNPCDNFYDYACGRWQKETPIPHHKMTVSTYSIIRDRVKHELSQSLNSAPNATDCKAVVKTKNLFHSCIDTDAIELRGATPLLKILKNELEWPILKNKPRPIDLSKTIASLRLMNNNNLIKYKIVPHRDHHILAISQGTVGISNFIYNNPEFHNVVKAYYALMYKTAVALGAKPSKALHKVLQIREFEKKFNAVIERWGVGSDLNLIMRLEDFSKEYSNNKINYLKIIKELTKGIHMTEDSEVMVVSPFWLKDIMKLIAKTDTEIIQNYIIWRFVKHRLNNLGNPFKKYLLEFRSTFGITASPPRWHYCSSNIMAALPGPTGKIFISKYFPPEKKAAAQELFQNVRKGFVSLLESEVKWMDAATKAKAKAKAEAIKGYFGYNPKIYNNITLLNEETKLLNSKPYTYFENTIQLLKLVSMRGLSLLNKRIDHRRVIFSNKPSQVNAFYQPSRNIVLLPAGEMQHPFYWGDKFPRMFQFGGIGTILGHEITHGFDNNGRKYDLNGNFHNWWSFKSLIEFRKRTNCIVNQFNNYYYKSARHYLKGKQCLGENIADLGGIRNSHAGYQFWLKSKGLKGEDKQPVTGLTNDQMFFVGFANVRCEKSNYFGALSRVIGDVHSPGKYRVIGSLRDFEGFSKAFNCPLGSYMNPRTKCILW